MFEIMRSIHAKSIKEKLSQAESLQLFQKALLEATKAPVVEPEEAEPEPPMEGKGEGDAEAAEAAEGGEREEGEEGESAPASIEPKPAPTLLGLGDVEAVLSHCLGTYFKHYALYQAAFGAEKPRPVAEPVKLELRVNEPPSTCNVLLPLAAAMTEDEWFAEQERNEAKRVAAEEAAAAEAEAEAEAERQRLLGEVEPEPEPEPEVEAEPEPEGEEGRAETEAEAEPETEPESEADVEAEPEAPPQEATLAMLLGRVVTTEMKRVSAHIDVVMGSRKATLLQKVSDLEGKLAALN
ncbi:hypothetical protein N9L31_00130 [bacterium]|nr:hypothetical protein [bacterium]